jgi:hypothetical protein
VSEHPVAEALAQLQSEITHTSAALTEDEDGHKAVMIGAVIGSRTILTKKGDTMGFIQLEDVQGTYECVAFPRTWKQTQDLWQKDKIVLVRGTIDGKGKVAKILLDSATDKPQVTSAVPDKKGSGISPRGSGNRDQKPNGNGQPPAANGKPTIAPINIAPQPTVVKEQNATYQAAPAKPAAAPVPKTNGQPVAAKQHPRAARPIAAEPLDNVREFLREEEDPFAGEIFAYDDEDPIGSLPPIEDFGTPQHDNPLMESTADYRGRGAVPIATAEPIVDVVKREFTASVPPASSLPKPVIEPQPVQVEPAPKQNGNGHGYTVITEPYRFAKVVISRSGDSTRDASTVGEVHHLLSSYPGPDRFCFLIKARGEMLQLDFPNDTTTLDDMLIDQLKSLHGVESVQISMSL